MQDCVGYLGTALCLTRPAQICSSVSDRQGTEMLEAQSILVTGSNRGIGLEIVRQLVGRIRPPQWIFATCREPEGPRAQELKNLLAMHQGVEIIQMDVADPSSIKAAAVKVTEKLQGAGLNLLINNAAIVKPNSLELESPEGMSDVYNTNVIGPMLVSQAFLPLLRKASQESPQKGMSCSKAAIVNMSSDAGSITNVLGWEFGQAINYRCSKAALNMLTRCQALEFAKDNILCIALHPGWVQTDMGNLVIPAPMALDTNVGAILNTLGRLTEKDNGTFVNWEGEVRPWGFTGKAMADKAAMLNARSVLVTGSNRGIGLEFIRQLLEKSNRPEWIFATCRDPEGPRAQELRNLAAKHRGVEIIQLEDLAKKVTPMSLPARPRNGVITSATSGDTLVFGQKLYDVNDPSSIRAAAARVTKHLQGAGLNLLINNAGILKPSTLESETPEVMAEVYKNNVIGPMMVTQAFLPLLRKASQESPQQGMSCSKAAIVNISSEGGSIANLLVWHLGHFINYRCSKAALNMLTRCQGLGLAEDEILCIALHPGWVQTDMGGSVGQAPMTVDASVQAILNTLGRVSEKDSGTFVNWEGTVVPW